MSRKRQEGALLQLISPLPRSWPIFVGVSNILFIYSFYCSADDGENVVLLPPPNHPLPHTEVT